MLPARSCLRLFLLMEMGQLVFSGQVAQPAKWRLRWPQRMQKVVRHGHK